MLMNTRTFVVTTSAATLTVSCTSGSIVQLRAWERLWGRLLYCGCAISCGALQSGNSRTA
jgi:hypothetical protein